MMLSLFYITLALTVTIFLMVVFIALKGTHLLLFLLFLFFKLLGAKYN